MTAGRHADPAAARARRDWQPWSLPIGVCATALTATAVLFAVTDQPRVAPASHAAPAPTQRAEAVRGPVAWPTPVMPTVAPTSVPHYEPRTVTTAPARRPTVTGSAPVVTERPQEPVSAPRSDEQPETVPVDPQSSDEPQNGVQPVETETATETTPTTTAAASTSPTATATPSATETRDLGDVVGDLTEELTENEETTE